MYRAMSYVSTHNRAMRIHRIPHTTVCSSFLHCPTCPLLSILHCPLFRVLLQFLYSFSDSSFLTVILLVLCSSFLHCPTYFFSTYSVFLHGPHTCLLFWVPSFSACLFSVCRSFIRLLVLYYSPTWPLFCFPSLSSYHLLFCVLSPSNVIVMKDNMKAHQRKVICIELN